MASAQPSFGLSKGPLKGPSLFVACVVLGAIAAMGLAWFMSFLIHASEMRLAENGRTQMLDFVRVKRNEQAERKDRKPERPQLTETPDTPPTDQSSQSNQQFALNVSAPADVIPDLDLRGGLGTGDGDYLPIVKVAPIYPRGALSRGIGGECTVYYTVTTAGTVRDVKVLEEQCPQAVFRKPSVEAALRFKYKPRVVDGVAVEVHNVRNRFYFEWKWAPDAKQQ